jgi:Flp pilus assembly pilin Flp
MKVACGRLWSEQDGAIVSAEIVLIATIVVIGLVAGLTSLRDSVVAELADVGQAISNLDQSFSFSGVTGHCGVTNGSFFFDTFDFCDGSVPTGGTNSKCVVICTGTTNLGGAFGEGTGS